MRPLLHFFCLGALLFAGQGALAALRSRAAVPTLRVVVKEHSTQAELERAIDEAVLVEQAIERGGALVDPVVREQLLSSMRERASPTDGHDDDAALLESALALGLHRADPVTRQRLVFQAEQLLTASSQVAPVSEHALTRYLQHHAERYRREARFTVAQVVLTRTHHQDPEAAAVTLLSTLQREDVPPADATKWGDASLLPHVWADAARSALDARLGAGFAGQLVSLPLLRWSGPVSSSYGEHLVFITTRDPDSLPTLASIRERVLFDYRHDHRRALLRARVRALRGSYRLDVRRLRS